MGHLLKKSVCILLLCFILLSIGSISYGDIDENELKGIWVASVFGIDYPSKATTSSEALSAEATKILDNIVDMGFNTVFLQVRPSSDALYKSSIYPWSHYLTGTQGLAPEGGFDPLAYFIEEAHRRGLALHAWINPYRVTAATGDNARLSPDHPALKYSELTVLHTDGKIYFNPGEPVARQLIIDGIAEILQNYKVDGIHMDDYFYPGTNFADEETFQKYNAGFGNIGDWRRNNNTELVKGIQAKVKELRSDAKFGISPFGIWANQSNHPLGSDTRGSETYYKMFADTRLWVKEGYLDYIMPQIYWSIGYEIADYKKILSWWSDVVSGTNVKLYIGQGAYKAVDAAPSSEWYNGEEIRRQVSLNRESSGVSGYSMYTYNSFMRNPSLASLIKQINHVRIETPSDVFPDIITVPQRKSIEYVTSAGIIKGYDDGKFYPYANIRRGDFVLMLTRMFDLGVEEGLSNFDDVKLGTYYYNEIATAKAQKLISGVDGIHFAPNENITNQDLYVMTYRALNQMKGLDKEIDESVLGGYKDENQIAEYARQAIAYFTEIGVFTKDMICPKTIVDRANAAEFIANIILAQDSDLYFNEYIG